MKYSIFKPISLLLLLLFASCKSLLIPEFVIDSYAFVEKKAALSEFEKQQWRFADPFRDSIPGISLDKAYEFVADKPSQEVIVAILDSGMDLNHEDFKGMLWVNANEIPNNGIDDDNNGYVDDIHGYNFLGDAYQEQLENTRILANNIGDASLQEKVKAEVEKALVEAIQNRDRYKSIKMAVIEADNAFKKAAALEQYGIEDLESFETTNFILKGHIGILKQMLGFTDSIEMALEEIDSGIQYFSDQVDYSYNINFNGRISVGDNPYDLLDVPYGNGNPKNLFPEESHGTHVAGIVGSNRMNELGSNGVADNVKLMSIRSVSNADEYDKDIALGIRYAVDNGAKIINCSFGKRYSPNKEWVYDAIKYAQRKNVLIVHAAGNDSKDIDLASKNPNYPNDHKGTKGEFVKNFISVGALAPSFGAGIIASFSNIGKENVDVFAPGDEIYSTIPQSNYKYEGGTSMAAPVVSGIAALVWSRYPNLKASELKKILMLSGTKINLDVIDVSEEEATLKPFDSFSKSGRIVNAYQALKLADLITNKRFKLKQYDY